VAASGDDTDLIEAIQTYLEDHGWEAQSGEGWVDHSLDNDHGTLHIDYAPPARHLGFTFETETHEVELGIAFGEEPDPVLDVITQHQTDLSETTWPSFMKELLASSPRVVVSAGDDGDEITPITTLEQGVQALAERDWEYYDPSIHSPEDIIEP
jgi:hypothetical protein